MDICDIPQPYHRLVTPALVPDGETLRVYAVPKGQENAVSGWYDLSERSPRVES